MKTKLWLAAFAVALAAAPAAMAQYTYSSTYSGSTGADRSTSTDMGISGRASSDTRARRTPGQKPVELQQTTLLNQLSAAGYVSVRDFRKDGDRYVANAMDRQGRWTTVVLDPHTTATTPTATPAR